MDTVDILVAGGGLAGLSAASALGDRALVLEQETIPGGLLRSPQTAGFTIDLVPHVFFTPDEQALRFFEEMVSHGRFHVREADARVFSNGVLTRFPFQCSLHGLPPDVLVECLLGFAGAGTSAGRTVGDFAAWVEASFGPGIARHFMVPYNTKLWGVNDLAELSSDWVGGKVITTELADVVEGAVKDRRFDKLPNATFRYPVNGGIQAFSDGIAARVKNLRLESEIIRVDLGRKVVTTRDGAEIAWRRLVWTLPLPALPRLVEAPLPQDLAAALTRLRWRDVAAIHLGIGRERIVPWHWMYYPEHEYPFYRVSFPGNKADSTVPPGCSSLIAECSLAPDAPLDAEDLLRRCIEGLVRSRILRSEDDIRHSATYRLSPAYVIHDHSRVAAVEAVTRYLDSHGVVTAGRFGHWRFYNMDRTLLSGLEAARKAALEE